MNKTTSKLVASLFVAGTMGIFSSCSTQPAPEATTNNQTEEVMNYDQIVHQRYSCKRFDASRQLTSEQLNAILEAGRVAPTAKNLQEQHVYVVQSQEMLEKIDGICPCRYGAPTCLVVTYDAQNVFTYPNSQRDSGVEDATIVATHMLLAAEAQGVNSCWINFFDPAAMAELVGAPSNEYVVMMLDLGFAAEGAGPLESHHSRKDLKETVTYL